MKKYLIGIVFLILVYPFYGQKDSVDYKMFYYGDSIISSEGYFYNKQPHGQWKNYYPNQNFKSIGSWEKGVLTGKWIFFESNSDTSEIINYRNGIKNGWNYKYQNNQIYLKQLFLNAKIIGLSYEYKNDLISEIPYKNGLKHGIAMLYRGDTVIEIRDYKNGFMFSKRKINRINTQGLKNGVWIDFYSNRAIKTEKNYTNDTLNGFYREYTSGGTLLKNLYYQMGILDTINHQLSESKMQQSFYPDGTLKTTGFFKNNKKVGLHQFYSQDGKITSAKLFSKDGVFLGEGLLDKNSKKTGLWKFYYQDKSLKTEGYYKRGRRVKEWKFYYINGKIEQKGTYKSGLYNGEWLHYDEKGNIQKKEEYRKGKLNGEYFQYNENQKVIIKGFYSDDLKDGHWQYIYSNITIDEYYDLGLKNGKFKSTYSNGELAFQGKFVQGLPDGKHVFYYQNGKYRFYQYYVSGSKEKIWVDYDEYGLELFSYTYKNNEIIKINGRKYEEDF